jgi:hypothetical protein
MTVHIHKVNQINNKYHGMLSLEELEMIQYISKAK